MSACSITLGGLDFSCRDSIGGIKRIWLAGWDAAAPELTADSDDEPRYTATASAFKLYRIRTGNGSMTSTLNADEANGTAYVTTELNVKFTKLTEDGRKEMSEILRGYVAAIVEDNQGSYWGLGLEHPVTVSAGTASTGAAMSDFAGYDLTLQDYASTLPYLVDETILASLPQTVGE